MALLLSLKQLTRTETSWCKKENDIKIDRDADFLTIGQVVEVYREKLKQNYTKQLTKVQKSIKIMLILMNGCRRAHHLNEPHATA